MPLQVPQQAQCSPWLPDHLHSCQLRLLHPTRLQPLISGSSWVTSLFSVPSLLCLKGTFFWCFVFFFSHFMFFVYANGPSLEAIMMRHQQWWYVAAFVFCLFSQLMTAPLAMPCPSMPHFAVPKHTDHPFQTTLTHCMLAQAACPWSRISSPSMQLEHTSTSSNGELQLFFFFLSFNETLTLITPSC